VWQLWNLAKARTSPKTIVHPLMDDAEVRAVAANHPWRTLRWLTPTFAHATSLATLQDAESKAATDLLTENAVVLEGPVRTTSEYRTESDLLESLRRRFLSGEVHKESKAVRPPIVYRGQWGHAAHWWPLSANGSCFMLAGAATSQHLALAGVGDGPRGGSRCGAGRRHR